MERAGVPTTVEVSTVSEERIVILRVASEEDSRAIAVAMTPEQAYAMALGLIGAVKHLTNPSPQAGGDGETVH